MKMSTYRDFANTGDDEIKISTNGGVKEPFPVKLFNMLEHIDLHEPELSLIVSWQPHGRCLHVHDQKKAEEAILPRFFNQRKYSSFRRQLNLWGFKRITQPGSDNGAYYNPMFLRSKPFLCRGINRIASSAGGSSKGTPSDPEMEPKFYTMEPLPPSPRSSAVKAASSAEDERSQPSLLSLGRASDLKDNFGSMIREKNCWIDNKAKASTIVKSSNLCSPESNSSPASYMGPGADDALQELSFYQQQHQNTQVTPERRASYFDLADSFQRRMFDGTNQTARGYSLQHLDPLPEDFDPVISDPEVEHQFLSKFDYF